MIKPELNYTLRRRQSKIYYSYQNNETSITHPMFVVSGEITPVIAKSGIALVNITKREDIIIITREI